MRWLDEQAIGYATSADMSPQLSECIAALPADHWKLDREEIDAIREWAEVDYLPSDGIWKKDAVSPRRYLATAPGRAAARRPSGAALLHRDQPLRSRRRQRSRLDPLASAKGRNHRAWSSGYGFNIDHHQKIWCDHTVLNLYLTLSKVDSMISGQALSLTESVNSRSCIYIADSRKMWYLGLSSSGWGDRNGRWTE
jgi:hypothetical protein